MTSSQDNGGKILQMLLALNLHGIPGREGNDAVDRKYRNARWVFAIYEGIEMRRAFFVPADRLEKYFSAWERKWNDTRKDINNPKVPLQAVIDAGELVYTDQKHLDLPRAARIRAERTRAAKDRRRAKAEAQAALLRDAGGTADDPASPARRKRS